MSGGGVRKGLRSYAPLAQHRARDAAAPLTPKPLFARLDALGIAHRTYVHPPVFTVAEAAALRGALPGGHCKSLFLKDKKGGLWLVVALEERRIDLKRLADALGAPRFSFGSAELLYEVLGVRPGSVTPFAADQRRGTAGRRRARRAECWSTIRSTTTRWKTTAPRRSRRAICCALSKPAGTRPRIVDLGPLDRAAGVTG